MGLKMIRDKNKKLNRAEKIRLIIFTCEIITTGVIPILLVFWDQMTLSVAVSILVADISVFFLISQFMENQLLSEVQEKQDACFSALSDSIDSIERNIDIDELYKKICTWIRIAQGCV